MSDATLVPAVPEDLSHRLQRRVDADVERARAAIAPFIAPSSRTYVRHGSPTEVGEVACELLVVLPRGHATARE